MGSNSKKPLNVVQQREKNEAPKTVGAREVLYLSDMEETSAIAMEKQKSQSQ